MGKGFDPRVGWNYSGFRESNCMPTNIRQEGLNPTALPMYYDPYPCCNFNGNVLMPFSRIETLNPYPMPSAPVQNSDQVKVGPGLVTSQKIFLVFDHTGDRTKMIFNPPIPQFPAPDLPNVCLGIARSSKSTDCSRTQRSHEAHEDTEEIDALLYSDSYDNSYGEEEASTGHSPLDNVECTNTLASNKRPHFDREPDASLTDTASSALIHFPIPRPQYKLSNTEKSSFVDGGEDVELPPLEEGETSAVEADFPRSKRARRDRIQETVSVLRRLIPHSKGKDAVSVLDEAIRYLKFVKMKAQAIGCSDI